MRKKEYQVPRIYVCKVSSQPVLAGSNPNADIKVEDTVDYGDDDNADVWEQEK